MKEFRSCPFCGSTMLSIIEDVKHYGTIFRVMCQHCGGFGPDSSSEDDSITSWNKRSYSELVIAQEVIDSWNEGE